MKKLYFSIFVAFMLSKLTTVNNKFSVGNNEGVFNSIANILNSLGISNIKAYEFLYINESFKGMTDIINYLLTYTPIVYVLILILPIIIKSLLSKNTKKKNTNNDFKSDNSVSKNKNSYKKSFSLFSFFNPIVLVRLIRKIVGLMTYLVPNPNTGMDFKSYLYIITGFMFIMNDRSDYLTTIVGLLFFFIVFICKFNFHSKTNLKTS